jgi:AraC-like DNA-binding protein
MSKHSQPVTSGFTVSAELIRGLVDCAVKCGQPAARFSDLLQQSGGKPQARYGGEHVLKLWDRVLRLSGDPVVGIRMAQAAGFKTFGALGEIVPRCTTVFESFKQAERYSALASQGAHVSVVRGSSTLCASVALDVASGPIQRNILLWGLTNLGLMPQRLTGRPVLPDFIECAFPSPAGSTLLALDTRCRFIFNARRNRVVFDRSIGDLGIPSADKDLQALLIEIMEQHLKKLGAAGSFERALKTIMREMLNGTMPTLASVGARTAMSPRTLQRRLAEAHIRFHDLLQEILHEEAAHLLNRGALTQGEIAFLLGYSEVSAFSRAYRRWTGHPPGVDVT